MKKKEDGAIADTTDISKYTTARSRQQAGLYEKITKKLGESVGKVFGQEMRLLVIQSEETKFTAPTLDEDANQQKELAWGKQYDMYLQKKINMKKARPRCL